MDKRRQFAPPVVGGSSLLVMFAVLCLTVFALLSLSTVQADRRLSDTSVQAVSGYSEADRQAEEIFAKLRAGELPAGVTETDSIYSYACTISDTQELRVAVRADEKGWTVLQWQAVSTANWQEDDSLDLWDGEKTER